MKLNWNNIENIRLTKNGNFRDIIRKKTYYLKICEKCGEEFLGLEKRNRFCDKICAHIGKHLTEETKEKLRKINTGKNNPNWGLIRSEETKQKISKANKGKKLKPLSKKHKKKISEANKGKKRTEETKLKMSKSRKGSKNPSWKGGYLKNGIPTYNLYATQLEWCEEVRRNKNDQNILEVKCFKCNKWFVPIRQNVIGRIQHLKGNRNTENRFYCSDKCRNTCSIYHKSVDTIMKEDSIRAGRLSWLELTREVQPELRQMVLERDNNECIKCGNTEDLQCHHIYPVNIEPLLSADVDNCITLCVDCHKEAHKIDGCRLHQLHMEEC